MPYSSSSSAATNAASPLGGPVTATPVARASGAHKPMAATTDPPPEREPDPESPAAAPAGGAAVPGARRRGGAKLTDGPLLTVLSMAVVALLVFVLTDLSGRISRLDDKVERVENKMEARFAAQDEKIEARFAAQDEKIDEINLKLTALIAALGMDDAVNAVLEGRVLDAPSS